MTNSLPKPTPKELGFHMPAEWERHSSVWLSWPHDPMSFPHLEEAENTFANFVAEIQESERIELQVLNDAMKERASKMLTSRGTSLSRIGFHVADYADIWFRDYGPIFVVNRASKELAMVKWEFNAWGDKYEALLKDNQVPYAMNSQMRLRLFEPGIVMEGGSIDVNGCGTVLTTRQCLLNPNRNPILMKEDIEKFLSDYLGATHCIWLSEGIEGDDTDGHIDDIARFVNPTTVVCALQEDKSDPDYAPLKENFDLLRRSVDQSGYPLTVVPLPMPGWVGDEEGRLPASYANFYIGNSKVLVPLFGTKNDEKAMDVLRPIFPDRQVVGVNATYLVYGLGTFHCMSQQQPEV